MNETRPTEKVFVVVAIALLVGTTALRQYEPYSFLVRDASFYATTVRGLAESGSLDQQPWQPRSWYDGTNPKYRSVDLAWSNVSLGADGTWYPKHSYVMPVLATPFYLLLGPDGLLLFNLLGAMAMLLGAWMIARRFASPLASLTAVLLVAISPAVIEHTYHFSLDIFTSGMVALGIAALLSARSIPAGILLGLAVWARPTLIPLIGPVALVALWQHPIRTVWIPFVLAAALPLTLAAIANTLMFGAPWVSSYERVLTVVNGVPVIATHYDCFNATWSAGLHRVVLDETTGLLYRLPIALVSLLALVSLWFRSRRFAIALGLATVGFAGVFLRYDYITARFFLPWMSLLLLPLAVLLDHIEAGASRAVLGATILWSRLGRTARWTVAASCVIAIAAACLVANPARRPAQSLSDLVDRAQVLLGEVPCDYFNMNLQRWECSQVEKDDWEHTGLALGDGECLFGGSKGPAIWFHPPKNSTTKRLRFPDLPRDRTLLVHYGLADSAVSARTCFTATWGDAPAVELCAAKAGELLSAVLNPPASGDTSLTLTITSPPVAKRHLCLDAVFQP
jgi:hypothetical protein